MPSKNQVKRKPISRSQHIYIDGNTARNLDVLPQKAPPSRKERPSRQQRRRPKENALPMNISSVLILGAAIALTVFMCIRHVELQSQIVYHMNTINSLEIELADLVSQNDETQNRIDAYIDLANIFKVATEELGMDYANKDQIIYYHNSGSEYARQYEDIPEVPETKGIFGN